MKKILCIILAILIASTCLCVGGCAIRKYRFVGKYESVFVDSQNITDSISFSLEIHGDKTFTLNGSQSMKGTWKAYTQAGKTQLLCLVEEGYTWHDIYPDAWNPYFSLCFLDDGTLMATPGTTVGRSSTVSVFGTGSLSMITLVLFEKQ